MSKYEQAQAAKEWEALEEAGDELGLALKKAFDGIAAKIPTYLKRLETVGNDPTDVQKASDRRVEKVTPVVDGLNIKALAIRQFVHTQLTGIAALIDTTTPDPIE